MRLRYLFPVVLLGLVSIIAGCNLFGWTSPESSASLVDEGKQHLRDGEYDEALAKFAAAIEDDPENADARYYHAKAAVHASGFNSLSLAQVMADGEFEAGDPFPFTGADWPDPRPDALYQLSNLLLEDLTPVYQHETHGSFDSGDVALDLGLAVGMKGLLTFQDTNLDGRIDDSDFDWIIEYFTDVSRGFQITNFRDYISQGGGPGKLRATHSAAPAPIDPALIAEINNLLDHAAELINESYDIIMSVATSSFGLDPEDVADLLTEVANTATYYRIGDGADNDGDGRTDEEIVNMLDDDGDGIIDEDSNGTWEL